MLKVRGLRKSYASLQVLRGVDLEVAEGEIVALLGPNGAGKTTLVSIAVGLRSADDGEVRVGGRDPHSHAGEIRGMIGLAPQDLGIYPTLSVEKNLSLLAELAGLRGAELRRRVEEVAEALGLVDLLGRRAGILSGGQQRRLHTGMALVHKPRMLFLDEPTVGADIPTRAQILEVVRSLAAEGCAVCYCTHYLAEVEELKARVAILEGGVIIADAPVGELIAKHSSQAVELIFDGPAPRLAGFEVTRSGEDRLVIETEDPPVAAAAALASLGSDTSRLLAVELVRPGLEAAYLALTGRRSAEEDVNQRVQEGSDDLTAA